MLNSNMEGRKNIMRVFRILMKILFSIIAACGCYLFFSVFFSLLPTHPPVRECPANEDIYIASNGVHLDIIIPVENLDPKFREKLDLLPGTLYIAFGWGDKEFYIKTPEWSDLTISVAIHALFLKSETALHVTCLPWSFTSWKKISLCDWQLERLNSYIHDSFKKDDAGDFIRMSFRGYNPYDSFYDARGSFSLFRTCNVWVNRALKEIEVKTSVWSPFDFGVLYHIR